MATKKRAVQGKSSGRTRKASGGDALGIVVYIHGIGAQNPADELKLEWDLALFGRDLGERSRMAYWADILHPEGPRESAAATIRESAARSFDVEATLRKSGVDPDDREVQELTRALLWEVGIPVAGVPSIGKRVLPLPAFLRKPISKLFLQAFIGDTAAYFFRADVRRKCRQRLGAALPPAGTPLTLVAHSQGTIISYEVLSALAGDDLDLIQFVTMGSPLGIREVQDFVEPSGLEVPGVVRRWHNFADPLDPVSLDKGLANDFTPRGFIHDRLVLNAHSRRLMEFNPHSAVGYLAHPDVRRVVHDAMRLDTMSRFVIARDVAETLAAMPQERHPVLIELLEPGYPAMGEDRERMQVREKAEMKGLRSARKEPDASLLLKDRIERAAKRLEAMVSDRKAAHIDPLRRFVAAHLTSGELRAVAAKHDDMRVYAVWRSSRKRKLTSRSLRVLKADAAQASFGASGEGITWAVLDTGIRADHPHFRDGTIQQVWDCTKPGRPVEVQNARDPDGHGTHVAGIIAGRAPDDGKSGERGLAPRAKLVVYKVLDDQGEGEDAWIIKALDHIAERNESHSEGLAIHGLNLSLGGPFDATVYGCGFSPICMELRRLWRDGMLVVVACGNEGQIAVDTPDGAYDLFTTLSIGDPANLEDCIAVGSVNADKPHLYGVSSFSSRGPTADGRPKPDVVAPGERISSCNSRYRANGTELYYPESGTSMAAPHVSGLLAAFLSVRGEFRGRPDEVKKILLSSCTDIGRDGYHQGKGLPNLMQMLLNV